MKAIDFLYSIDINNFEGWMDEKYDYIDNILDFEKLLTVLLKRKIDLIPDSIILNKYLKKSIEQSKQLIYAA